MFETTIRVLGVGKRISGIGANGAYDFAPIHFAYDAKGVRGEAVGTCNIKGHQIDLWQVEPGRVYIALLSFRDYKPSACYLVEAYE